MINQLVFSCEINICSASFKRRLREYPATCTEIGSPSGAIKSTLTLSPGIQPISMSFKKISLLEKDSIIPFSPAFNSDNFFNLLHFCNANLSHLSPVQYRNAENTNS